jgi:uncharacterized oxidoreductase
MSLYGTNCDFDPQQSLDTFNAAAMAGLEKGQTEISVGLAKVLRIGRRLAPGLFLNIVNKLCD